MVVSGLFTGLVEGSSSITAVCCTSVLLLAVRFCCTSVLLLLVPISARCTSALLLLAAVCRISVVLLVDTFVCCTPVLLLLVRIPAGVLGGLGGGSSLITGPLAPASVTA